MTRTVLIKGVRYRVRVREYHKPAHEDPWGNRVGPMTWRQPEWVPHDPWYVRLWRWYCYRSNGWRAG